MLKTIALLSALAASAMAQATIVTSSATATISTATQEMPAAATMGFNPALVNRTTALSWCRAQTNSCPQICGGRISQNSCNENQFTYTCVCSNGTVPDCTAFTQTLPYFICEETYSQCLNNHPSTDPQGQQQCIDDRQCGTGNATAQLYAGQSSAASSAGGSATGSASASGASSTSSQGAAASTAPVSSGAFVALLFALCKLVL